MKPLAALLLCTLALAGCLEESPESPDDDGDVPSFPDEEPMAPTVATGSGTVTGGGAGGVSIGNGGHAVEATVQAGAKVLFAEIRWDDAATDLDLALSSPAQDHDANPVMYDYTAEGGSPAMPDSPHNLTVENPAEGQWLGSAFANGAGADVAYEVAITVFYEESSVPAGYTGFA